MRLENLEELTKASVCSLIVTTAINGIDNRPYHSKYEAEIALRFALITLIGSDEMKSRMNNPENDWIEFAIDIEKDMMELKKGEYGVIYEELFSEVLNAYRAEETYNQSVGRLTKIIEDNMTPEMVEKMTQPTTTQD